MHSESANPKPLAPLEPEEVLREIATPKSPVEAVVSNNHRPTNVERISADELAILEDAKREVDGAQRAMNIIIASLARKYRLQLQDSITQDGTIIRQASPEVLRT